MDGVVPEEEKAARVAAEFEPLFNQYCKGVDQGRETKEKKLQSWLISDAYTHAHAVLEHEGAIRSADLDPGMRSHLPQRASICRAALDRVR